MDVSTSSNLNYSVKMSQFQAYQKNDKEGTTSVMEATYIEFEMASTDETKLNMGGQLNIFDLANKMERVNSNLSQSDLAAIGYEGKPLGDLTQQEAADLVSEDGFFGIKKTSQRVADFVLMGAGDDIEKLRAGREGILQGFKDAERIWGEKLPEISYKTLDKTLEMIDKKIEELGYSVIDEQA